MKGGPIRIGRQFRNVPALISLNREQGDFSRKSDVATELAVRRGGPHLLSHAPSLEGGL